MERQTCFKCCISQPLENFYKHPMMTSGRLGKCKDCAKEDVRQHYRATIEERQEYERRRNQTPSRRAAKTRYRQQRRERHPEKDRANRLVLYAIKTGKLVREPCRVCGAKAEGHHEDYSRPLEVDWLCLRHHRERHKQLADIGITL